MGESVRISLVVTEAHSEHIAVKPTKNVAEITVLSGSTAVFHSTRSVHALPKINSRRAVMLTTLWRGEPNQAGIKKLSPGAYTIEVEDDGFVASKIIEISSRHANGRTKGGMNTARHQSRQEPPPGGRSQTPRHRTDR